MTRSAIAVATPCVIPRLKNSPASVLNIKVTPSSSGVVRTNWTFGRRITIVFFSVIRIPLGSFSCASSIGEARGLRQWLVAGLTRMPSLGVSSHLPAACARSALWGA